jgi:hypothetical protein
VEAEVEVQANAEVMVYIRGLVVMVVMVEL